MTLLGSADAWAEDVPTVHWNETFDAGDSSFASGVGRGPDGHPVVAGTSCVIGTSDCAVRVIKYDSFDGSEHWNVTFHSGSGRSDGGFAVDVGADGHPIVAGSSCDANDEHCTLRLIKFDGLTGGILWNVANSSGHGSNGAYGVAIGPDGHPITAQWSCLADSISDCELRSAKYSAASGSLIWSTVFASGQGYEQPNGVAVGADGHAVVTGISCTQDLTDCDFRTIKFDGANGTILWNVSYDSGIGDPGTIGDYAAAVAIGPDGHPVVTGDACSTAVCDARATHTLKYDGATGAAIWTDIGGVSPDFGIAIGSDGDPVTVGFALTKRDGGTGASLWTTLVGDSFVGASIGTDGNPVIVGFACDEFGGCDFRTVKYLIQEETPTGSNVVVDVNTGTAAADGVTLTFTNVTTSGTTSLVTATAGPVPPPSGFGFIGTPPTYYDVSTTASFTGTIQVCVNYTNLSFASPENLLQFFHFEGGAWVNVTSALDTDANVICGSVSSLSPFAIGELGVVPSGLGPAHIWVGLKNSDDVGIKFDLRAEVYRNGTDLVASGQINSVPGGSSGFNNARLRTIDLTAVGGVALPSGSTLGVRVMARNACVGSGKNSGGARLWYNDFAANSRVEATLGLPASYHLLNGFTLATSPGGGPKKTADVAAGAKCSPFKTFGTWTTTVP